MLLAASMYSLFFICLTSVLTILDIFIQLVIPITMDIDTGFEFPSIACTNIIINIEGILSMISVNLIIASSTSSDAEPLILP